LSRDGTGEPSIHQSKAKKRGRRLMIAYALRGVIFLLPALMILLAEQDRGHYKNLPETDVVLR
jgi:hypothetical protein